MKCVDARSQILERARGRLAPGDAPALDAHLAECADCRRAVEVERATDELLARRPIHRVPAGLEERLRARIAEQRSTRSTEPKTEKQNQKSGRISSLTLLLAAAFVITLAIILVRDKKDERHTLEARLVDETVNDHLRILYSEHPLDVVSSDSHTVKPWFAGKLDFAPRNVFEGDADFPLQGGSVAVVVDRKAAALVYKRRLHLVTLFITRADGLTWPPGTDQVGPVRVHAETVRGFNTVTWTDGELGYALVSDVNRADLFALAGKLTAR